MTNFDNILIVNSKNILNSVYNNFGCSKENVFISFLPKSYWQKRGLILVLQHPLVQYLRLPKQSISIRTSEISIKELNDLFNPVLIAKALQSKNPEWLRFYINHEFGVKINDDINPFEETEFLGKLIFKHLAVLNHSQSNDVSARYILPLKTLFNSLLMFPDKFDKAKSVFTKVQNNFFEDYNLIQLMFLLEAYKNLNSSCNTEKFEILMTFYSFLFKCKNFSHNSFDKESIVAKLDILSSLYNQYVLLKNEQ